MVRNGWYCCNDCGHRLLAVNNKAVVEGVRIPCKGKRGHTDKRVRAVRIEPKRIHDREGLQAFIETAHVSMNRGECQSYNICRYCLEPGKILRNSPTPCADAFLLMFQKTKKKDIFSIWD